MLVMVTGTYPLKSTKKIVEAFMKAYEKPMSHANQIGSWICYGGEGVNVWMVYELEKGHEEDGLMELVKTEVHFFDIEGYKVNFQTVMKPEDAMSLIQ